MTSKLATGIHIYFCRDVIEHATLSAGSYANHRAEVGITVNHRNRAADRGCCVSYILDRTSAFLASYSETSMNPASSICFNLPSVAIGSSAGGATDCWGKFIGA